jgi:hypothetical protein
MARSPNYLAKGLIVRLDRVISRSDYRSFRKHGGPEGEGGHRPNSTHRLAGRPNRSTSASQRWYVA